MRIHFPDLVRPKQAAKYLARASTELKLAMVHEAVARALGYRDWHELSITSHLNVLANTDSPDLDGAVLTILELADALGIPDGHVQYAISRARLLRATPWSIDEHTGPRRCHRNARKKCDGRKEHHHTKTDVSGSKALPVVHRAANLLAGAYSGFAHAGYALRSQGRFPTAGEIEAGFAPGPPKPAPHLPQNLSARGLSAENHAASADPPTNQREPRPQQQQM